MLQTKYIVKFHCSVRTVKYCISSDMKKKCRLPSTFCRTFHKALIPGYGQNLRYCNGHLFKVSVWRMQIIAKVYTGYGLVYVNHSQTLPRVCFGYAKPYARYSLAEETVLPITPAVIRSSHTVTQLHNYKI